MTEAIDKGRRQLLTAATALTGAAGVALLPPVDWPVNFVGSKLACSMRTFFHSTSSSSAMIMGSIVFTP